MKKILLSLWLLLGVAAQGLAFDVIPVPKTQSGNDFTDGRYGGVRFSTSNFFATNTNGSITLPVGAQELGVSSVFISSGPGSTYVLFFSSYSWSPSTPYFLQVSNSTSSGRGDSTGGTLHQFNLPYRVERSTSGVTPALIYRVINGDDNQRHNSITIGYVVK